MTTFLSIIVDGVAYGMVLFMISVGLAVTMGLMRVVNMAHGAFAMLGGLLAHWLIVEHGVRFELAMMAAVGATMVVAIALDRLLYRRIYRLGDLEQVLLTIGIVFLSIATANLLFGSEVRRIPLPAYLTGSHDIGFRVVANHRIVLVGLGMVIALALWLLLDRTRYGINLRAAVDNGREAACLGINTTLLYTATFVLGSGLAAFGGIMGAEMMPIEANYPLRYMILFLLVVSVSGFGSVVGSLLAALALGIVDTAGRYLVPDFGSIFFYIVIILLLTFRPHGIWRRA